MAKHKLIKCHKFGRFSWRYRDFYIQEVRHVDLKRKQAKEKLGDYTFIYPSLLDWIVMSLDGKFIQSCQKPRPTRGEMKEWVDNYYDKLEGAN